MTGRSHLHLPSMSRVLPVEVFDFTSGETSKLSIDISLVAASVVSDLPEVQTNGEQENGG